MIVCMLSIERASTLYGHSHVLLMCVSSQQKNGWTWTWWEDALKLGIHVQAYSAQQG